MLGRENAVKLYRTPAVEYLLGGNYHECERVPMPQNPPSDAIPNQVFIGAPWHTVRPKYERAIVKLRKKYPLSFVIVGRSQSQEAEDLLQAIKEAILGSSYAIFDATGGNPNVSLEYGFAEAHDIQRALYLSTHAASKTSTDTPIIADLALNQAKFSG
jgi:hypothetical protein